MPTYTATIDTTGMVYPNIEMILIYRTCESIFSIDDYSDFTTLVDGLQNDLQNYFLNNGITTQVIITSNDPIIQIMFNLSEQDLLQLPCSGELVGCMIVDWEKVKFNYKFDIITPELCPTCQDVTMDNCGSVIFEAAIPDGTYKVRIQDNQSGVTYYQNLEFTASQGTWDQTNTAGVFTPFSTYTVTILDDNGDPVSWVDGTNEYTCMRLTFATFTDTTPEG